MAISRIFYVDTALHIFQKKDAMGAPHKEDASSRTSERCLGTRVLFGSDFYLSAQVLPGEEDVAMSMKDSLGADLFSSNCSDK